jgi:hypothetical protein
MYIWNYHALAQRFKTHTLTTREKLKYLLAIMIYVPTGLMGSNWVPGIYRLIYAISNKFLATKSSHVPPLKVFNDFNSVTDIVVVGIVGLGVILCYWTNRRGDGRNFIERFMCLSIPISIRISVYVLVIFFVILGSSLVYFYFKLQLIAQTHGFLVGFKQLKRLKRLMPVMAFISHRVHILSCVMAVTSLIWSFFLLNKEIRYIAKK